MSRRGAEVRREEAPARSAGQTSNFAAKRKGRAASGLRRKIALFVSSCEPQNPSHSAQDAAELGQSQDSKGECGVIAPLAVIKDLGGEW